MNLGVAMIEMIGKAKNMNCLKRVLKYVNIEAKGIPTREENKTGEGND